MVAIATHTATDMAAGRHARVAPVPLPLVGIRAGCVQQGREVARIQVVSFAASQPKQLSCTCMAAYAADMQQVPSSFLKLLGSIRAAAVAAALAQGPGLCPHRLVDPPCICLSSAQHCCLTLLAALVVCIC